jgi:hypothetical protein
MSATPLLPTQQPGEMDNDLFEELYASSESSDIKGEPDNGNESEDTGNRCHWDPHVSMKPSCQHGRGSDDEVDLEFEEDLPYGTNKAVNNAMVNLMWNLNNDDPHNVNWIPPAMHRPEPVTKGIISLTDPRLFGTYCNVQGRGKPLHLALTSVQNLLNHNNTPSTNVQ